MVEFGGNMADFEDQYRKEQEPVSLKDRTKKCIRNACSKQAVVKCAKKHCQVWDTLKTYKVCEDFPRDILSGISVGIMHIPQSMAYSLLATLPPICGLYTALFAPLVYIFLGTSKHLSMGAITVVSLMIAAVLDRKLDIDGEVTLNISENSSLTSVNNTAGDLVDQKVEIAVAISFVSGAFMIVLGKLGLGVITTYMSEPLISAFTSGVAVHVLVSQMKNILGLRIRRNNGMLKIFKTLVEVFKNVEHTNIADLVTSLVCILLLYLVKVHINHRFRSKIHIPIPIELIVIILGTVASYFLRLQTSYGVQVVGAIPAGLPSPRMPQFNVVQDCIPDAILIGIVAFGQSVSMAKILARRNNYKIQPNQEMVAYGAGSMVCAVFSGYITAGSVARSLVQETTGARTQIASIFSCVVVFVVIMAVGPLFFALPQCVLSSVILVALRSMFLQIRETRTLWKTSKYDLLIWVVTYASVVILDADIGLGMGIIFSVLTVVIRTQRTKPVAVGRVGGTSTYRPIQTYKEVRAIQGVTIIRYSAPLYFANVDSFLGNVFKCLNLDLEQEIFERQSDSCQPCRTTSGEKKHKKHFNSGKRCSYTIASETSSTSETSSASENDSFTTEKSMDSLSSYVSDSLSGVQNAGELSVESKYPLEAKAPDNMIAENRFAIEKPANDGLPFSLLDPKAYWNLKSFPSTSSFSSTKSDDSASSPRRKFLIFDLSNVLFIDAVGVKTLKQLITDCDKLPIDVLIAECNDDVLEVLKTCGDWKQFAHRLYLTVEDAERAASNFRSTDCKSGHVTGKL